MTVIHFRNRAEYEDALSELGETWKIGSWPGFQAVVWYLLNR